MSDETPPTASGRDLARQTLAVWKANGRPGVTPIRRRRPAGRVDRTGGRDPVSFADLVGTLSAEQGWKSGLDGGSVLERWVDLCPQFVGKVDAVAYDADRGRLDLRPGSDAYATQLRLLSGQLAKQINDKLGKEAVRAVRVLSVGALASPTVPDTAPEPAATPEAPVRTRETASSGYRLTLAAALEHKPTTEDLKRNGTGAKPKDPLQASVQAALAYKHNGGREPRRLFGTA
ncbi:DciA family protein [Streptomyces sp. NPDC048479]|uniref:DciA family protein n=1 Tax=Streptomyces sp. NPDC048479 TaxID=3154725 RepID=UPI0034136503